MASIRRPRNRLRNTAACSATVDGTDSLRIPSARRNPTSASEGGIAPFGSRPRRSRYSSPSGKRSATRCPQCTARAVLPTPAVPQIRTLHRCGSTWSSRSSRSRPVVARLSWRRVGPRLAGRCAPALTHARGGRTPRAQRPANPNASASIATVLLRGTRLRDSNARTLRALTPPTPPGSGPAVRGD
jgi:hypothetical protein